MSEALREELQRMEVSKATELAVHQAITKDLESSKTEAEDKVVKVKTQLEKELESLKQQLVTETSNLKSQLELQDDKEQELLRAKNLLEAQQSNVCKLEAVQSLGCLQICPQDWPCILL